VELGNPNLKEHLKEGDLSISSGEPTVANSDSEDEQNPVWLPLKEEIDSNLDEAEEKLVTLKQKQSKRLKNVFGGSNMESEIVSDGEAIMYMLMESD
jgi:hypothetical protein